MIVIGFTGTRSGMNAKQKDALRKILEHNWPCEFHHGDCVGADAEAAEVFKAIREERGKGASRLVAHPGDIPAKRAHTTGNDYVHPEQPTLERNRHIISLSDVLLGAPKEREEQPRGGTWYTIRRARKINCVTHVLFP